MAEKRITSITLSPDVHRLVKKMANAEHRSFSAQVEILIMFEARRRGSLPGQAGPASARRVRPVSSK